MTVEIEFENNFAEVSKRVNDHLKGRMHEAVMEVRNTTLETLSGPRSGREYYVPGTKTKYISSAPGEAPAQPTGRLRQSIATEVSDDGKVGVVGTEIEYGLFLELGTSRMQPRPWLRPSFEKSVGKIKEIFTRPM